MSTTAQPATHPEQAANFSHRALLYGSDEDFLAGAVPFLREGLAAGQACMAITAPANVALLRGHLPDRGGQVVFADPAAFYASSPGATTAGVDDCIRGYEQQGRRVRIVGEPRWSGRGSLARRAWQRYEAALNPGFVGRDAALLCAYDTRALDSDIVTAARRTHAGLSIGGQETPSSDYVDPAAFCAECDAEPLPTPLGSVAEMGFDWEQLGLAREFTTMHAERAGMRSTRVADLVLAVDEVTANAVRHGAGQGRLRAWREGHSLVFEVVDDCDVPPDPLVGQLPPRQEPGHGYGLWIARQLADLVEIRHGPGWQVRLYTDLA